MKAWKIFIAGHNGMMGSAVHRALTNRGCENIVTRTSKELDLRDQSAVKDFFSEEKPEVVINAAARVGGIHANINFPYEFLMDSMQIQSNLIDTAYKTDVRKFVFLGSSCIYPETAPQPLKEDDLLTGTMDGSNSFYGIAKISGIKACEALRTQFDKDFVSLVPSNLYGTFDHFNPESSHVLASLIRKFEEAKNNGNEAVTVWGSGKAKREFLYVDDLADAVCFALENTLSGGMYNVGTGEDIEIRELAARIQEMTGHTGEVIWDHEKPEGTLRKVLDTSKMGAEGWKYTTSLDEGLKKTYRWYLKNRQKK